MLDKFIQGISALVMVFKIYTNKILMVFFFFSELYSVSRVKILYTMKDKFATKIVYVHNNILPQPEKI